MPASASVAFTGQADSLRPPQVQPHANGPSRSMAQGPTNAQHRTHKHSTSADMMDPRLQKPSQVSSSPLSATIPHLILYNVNNIQQMLTYPLQKRKHDKDLPTVPGLEVPRISRPTQMSVSLTSHLPPLLCLPASLSDPTIGNLLTPLTGGRTLQDSITAKIFRQRLPGDSFLAWARFAVFVAWSPPRS
jgi:hypothetical protein